MSKFIVYAIGNCQTIALLYYLREFTQKETPVSYVYIEYREDIGYTKTICHDLKIPFIKYKHFDDHHKAFLQACDFLFCQPLDPTIYTFHYDYLKSQVKAECEIITLPSIFLSHPNEPLNKKQLEQTLHERINILKAKEIEKNVTIPVAEFIRQNHNKTTLFNHPVHPNTILFTYICLMIQKKYPKLPLVKITRELVSQMEQTKLLEGENTLFLNRKYNLDVLNEWLNT